MNQFASGMALSEDDGAPARPALGAPPPPPPPPGSLGELLGAADVGAFRARATRRGRELLGRGAFATVTRVTERGTGREFAASASTCARSGGRRRAGAPGAAGAGAAQRLAREVDALRALPAHAHLVALADGPFADDGAGELVLVLELARGSQLRRDRRRAGRQTARGDVPRRVRARRERGRRDARRRRRAPRHQAREHRGRARRRRRARRARGAQREAARLWAEQGRRRARGRGRPARALGGRALSRTKTFVGARLPGARGRRARRGRAQARRRARRPAAAATTARSPTRSRSARRST